jgi:hypothetical protein
MKKTVLIIAVWYLFNLSTATLAPNFIPYRGFFPYEDQVRDYRLPKAISSWANFHGIHYLLIARWNYSQYEQAYFPLYPSLIHILTPFFNHNHLFAGLFISNLFFILGLLLFSKLVNEKNQHWSILLLLSFPTSFFFSAIYTEGLFLFLILATLYCFKRKFYFWAGILGLLTALSRLIGVLLVIPLTAMTMIDLTQSKRPFWQKLNIKIILTLLAPLLGLGLYSLFLWKTTGDPLFFFNSQPVFGANRSTNLIFPPQVLYRYAKIIFTANHDYAYFISIFELVIFLLVITVLLADLFEIVSSFRKRKTQLNSFRLGLNLFSIASLILPTLTGTFSSIPRYALLAFSFYIFLAERKKTWPKLAFICLFWLIHIVVLAFFVQGYFIS